MDKLTDYGIPVLICGLLMWVIAGDARAEACEKAIDGMYAIVICQECPRDETSGECRRPWPQFHDTSTASAGYQFWLSQASGLQAFLAPPYTLDKPDLLRIIVGYTGNSESKRFGVTVHGVQNFSPEPGMRWTFGDQSGVTDDLRVDGLELSQGERLPLVIRPPKPERPKWKLAYTWQPRPHTEICQGDDCITDASYAPTTNDVGNVLNQSESDVMVDDLGGNRKKIFDCTGDHTVICAAQEASVSPNGRYLAFPVSYAGGNGTAHMKPLRPRNSPVMTNWQNWAIRKTQTGVYGVDPESGTEYPLPWEFKTVRTVVYVYDLLTDELFPVTEGRDIDRMVEWASNDLLVFPSDRSHTYAPLSWDARNWYPDPAFHLYRARVDFDARKLVEFKDLTPGAHNVMTPLVLSDGWIAYSAFHGVHPRYISSTQRNHWWIEVVDINGDNIFVELGAHGTEPIYGYKHVQDIVDPNRRSQMDSQFLALAGLGEIRPGYLATGSYYAANHMGRLGNLYGTAFTPDFEGALRQRDVPELLQGQDSDQPGSARFVPRLIDLTPFAVAQDQPPRFHRDGRVMPKAGYPSHYWGDAWIYTLCRGICFNPGRPGFQNTENLGGEPLALKQINVAYVNQITDPFDPEQTERLACGDKTEHCWDAVAIGPYSEFFGVEAPQIAEVKPEPEACFMNVVNARAGEIHPIPGGSEQDKIDFQGNADPDFMATMTHLKFVPFEPWPKQPGRVGLYHTLEPILAKPESDGSVRVEVPCGVPVMHSAWDADREKDVAEALNPIWTFGELFCHGCHDGHSEERWRALGAKSAEERFKETEAYRKAGGE